MTDAFWSFVAGELEAIHADIPAVREGLYAQRDLLDSIESHLARMMDRLNNITSDPRADRH